MLMAATSAVLHKGCLDKMQVTPGAPAQYALPLNDMRVPMNQYIGQRIRLQHTGVIRCTHCNRVTKKKFQSRLLFSLF